MTSPDLRIEISHPIPTEENAGLLLFSLLHSYLEIARLFPSAQVEPDLVAQARKELAQTGVPATPFSKSVAGRHIAWLHHCLRESGHCIDGAACQQACGAKNPCAREHRPGGAPLWASALSDDWTLEGKATPRHDAGRSSFDPGAAARLRSIVNRLGVSAPESDAEMMGALFAVLGNVRAGIDRLMGNPKPAGSGQPG
ncbi:hypothetical protein [Paraburkholderia sp. J8-2]|uniref:hypothetical protein n=1 Tax=Paraburkholderia sp. J8-2 TaxID=2805440 RepID=UPI002AB645A4|nr:hypothetical protein [Paraburkholderia sp. J8-2]